MFLDLFQLFITRKLMLQLGVIECKHHTSQWKLKPSTSKKTTTHNNKNERLWESSCRFVAVTEKKIKIKKKHSWNRLHRQNRKDFFRASLPKTDK